MARSKLPVPLPPLSEFYQVLITEPFPFLKLPKEIRLMVYEQLPITTNKHRIPMKDPAHHVTLVNPSISGIRILATCRQIKEEASYILMPHLIRMLRTPPEIRIEAKHLIGLIDFDEKFFQKNDILDRIMTAVGDRTTRQSIHRYRDQGAEAFGKMAFWVRGRGLLNEDDDDSVKAIATFVLRAYEYARTYPSAFYKYPPINIIVNVPGNYQRQTVTATVSRAMQIYHRIFFSTRRRRQVTGIAKLSWLFCRLAFLMALKSSLHRTLGVCIKLRHTRVEHGRSRPVSEATEHKIHVQIMQGVYDAGCNGRRLVYYGGVVQDGDEGVEMVR
ncbi:hypothetical protein T440DRAFT_442533 [Plenodomus tracheiphilus IPT5]|uniref:F-box domain-containing protein n=1 Tax=Plenodomus tracheiphilus IPT5 TaxID=1408161 RepID=A0A6A7BFA8_9PLEO|nr:hypothetical protein T440DRAFT_442533 [Plenodomus tracheiphilus IPT5]